MEEGGEGVDHIFSFPYLMFNYDGKAALKRN